ncbi:hypothetical protein SAMN05660691_00079 [Rheinheimera pacifica]|uniref:Uncharacterized protein n=1 Tax=Rheinheimera pacifica TaxID=173990 RepID=A0A1H6J3Y4_9GAMM|nr:hypothetical protein [Rheinheimera pacifica]SEH55376.1 hypothetical protein SAMN05660691_00079 [Rheinheimera pacifica]
MKLVVFVLFFSSMVTACQSASPRGIVKKQSYEQEIHERANALKAEMYSWHDDKKYELALLYSFSFYQRRRKLAIPLLKELADKGHMESITVLTGLEFMGDLGYVSDASFEKYQADIKVKDPEHFSSYKSDQDDLMHISSEYFNEVKIIYDSTYHLCEQLIDQHVSSLERSPKTYLLLSYLNRCLTKYSVRNSSSRLMATAKYQELLCKVGNVKENCISEGYAALSSGSYNLENASETAAALRKIYRNHKLKLAETSGLGFGSMTKSTGAALTAAFKSHDAGEFSEGVDILLNYLKNNPKLNPHETAFVHRGVSLLLIRRSGKGDLELAAEYGRKALDSNELEYESHWNTFDLVADLYYQNKDYINYIAFISNHIIANQGSMDIIQPVVLEN